MWMICSYKVAVTRNSSNAISCFGGFRCFLAWQRDIAIPFYQESGGCYGFNLSFDEDVTDLHVTNLESRCWGSLCQIGRVKYLLDRSTLIKIINA
ncbi:hypothetical protein P5673_033049 [Acropora cervicornis]|uniref:Uncharacterized protein n=1 Tax=Acropora cervicornis TaxID=6130 RepID=A0AAD9PQH3_ACRCE|nr:hypothetical protein P5673_033049 [Acropora cervicornis]